MVLVARRPLLAQPQYIFRDEFDRCAIDKKWTITDTESKISEAAGKLSFSGGRASPGWGDPARAVNQIIQRVAGVCLEVDIQDIAAANKNFWVGFNSDTSPGDITSAETEASLSFRATGALTPSQAATAPDVATYAATTPYRLKLILGSYDVANRVISPNGFMIFVQGGAFGTLGGSAWTLLYRFTTGSTASLYPAISNYNADMDFGYVRVYRHLFPMPRVYDSAVRGDSAISPGIADSGQSYTVGTGPWGISTSQIYCVNANADDLLTLVGMADGIHTCKMSVVADDAGLVFRHSAANAFWLVRHSGTDWQLRKQNAGWTTIGAWTGAASNNDVVTALTVGSSIRVYINGTQRISATDAFNSAATGFGLYANSTNVPRFKDLLVQGGLP